MRTRPSPTTLVALALALGPIGAAGCSHGPRLPDGPGVDRYALVSVNGGPLPTTVQSGRFPVRVYSGEFRISDDGECGSQSTFGESDDAEKLVRGSVCRYVQDGDAFTITWEGSGGTSTGTLEGDVFTMDNHGTIFRYRRAAR